MNSFLNTTFWEEFQKNAGHKTFRFSDDGYAIKLDLPFGKSYLYSPSPKAPEFLDEIRKTGKKENVVFFKWEPMTRLQQEIPNSKIKQLGFKTSPKPLQPQRTIILDLNKSEEVLLNEMHKKWRYNVRLAARKGVVVSESDNFMKFWELLKKTAQKDNFHTHPKTYYEKLFKLQQTKLFCGERSDKVLACALVVFHAKRATYLHGASDYKYRKYMAPHLMHREIARYAKEKKFSEYDLWGIDEKKWPGVTRFKRGFGGKEVEYIGSFDLPIQKLWYSAYKLKNSI